MQVYNEDGTNNILNVAPEGDIVRMRPGEHSPLLYNNDTEYIVFDDMNSFASAKATTRTRTRASYAGNPYMENTVENTVNAPICFMATTWRTTRPNARLRPTNYP